MIRYLFMLFTHNAWNKWRQESKH